LDMFIVEVAERKHGNAPKRRPLFRHCEKSEAMER
jgi:hypothetical protein